MSSPRLRATPPLPIPESPLSVLYMIDSLGPGGAERLLADYLPRLARLGVEPTVVTMQDREGNPIAAEIEAAGVPVANLGIRRLREPGALARVAEVIERTAPDLVHTQLEFSNILGTLAAHRLGVPAVATIHTIDRPRGWSRDAARYRLMAWILRSRGSRVISVSRSARDHFIGRSKARRDRVVTLHSGIELSRFSPGVATNRSAARAELGIAADASVAMTVAVLRPEKGIADMVDALPAVVPFHPSTHYVVVGNGSQRPNLERIVAGLGLEDRVLFTGARSDIPRLLAAADVFVLPSHTEALPTVLIEAMAAGLPVVATEVGGIPEMVDRGSSALLVPPHSPAMLADAVCRLFSSPIQSAAMGRAGRRIASERFDLDRQAARLVDEYRLAITAGVFP
jgi:glycosyltransferase involved in cell wall biosynthesis